MTKLCIGAVIIFDPRQTFSQKLTAPRRRSSALFRPLRCCYHYGIIGRSRSSIDKPGGSVAIGRLPLAFLDLRPSRRAASKTSGEGERDLDLDPPWRAEWRRNLGRKSIERAVPEVSAMGAEAGKKGGVIALFDVDGTLTPARKEASTEMLKFLQDLRKVVSVGVVGGSDLIKISEQLGKNTTSDYDYVFSENGLVAYKNGKLIGSQSLKAHLGEEKLKKFLNFVLHYVADLDIPIKRGTFIEFRMGMLNVSPIGRNCSYEEREEFERYDKVHNVRSKFVEVLKEKFADYSLMYSIGGQISFDVFPRGWDKTFCLSFVEKEFNEIHFFGDKTYKGGNDHEIFESEKTIGHTVTSPEDTRKQCTKLFL